MTHRWIKSSCVVVVLNAVLVLGSILHRQSTGTIDLPISSTTKLAIETQTTVTTSEGDRNLNPEVAEFQKLRAAGLAPDLANLEAKPVPEDDKLMAELRKKAAEAFPISEGLSEPQSIFSQSPATSVEDTLSDTPQTRKSNSLLELSAALVDLAKLTQHFERLGDSAKVKKISEQIQALEKIMQELLATPAF